MVSLANTCLLSSFIDMISHELRNPLSAILQCAEEISTSLIASEGAGDLSSKIPVHLIDSTIDAAQTIALCASHQSRIVSDVLTLSKLDAAKLLVTPIDVKPVAVVRQALKMFDGELVTADIKIVFQVDEPLQQLKEELVKADPSRLLKIIINLLTNAIKFTSSQPKRLITGTLWTSTVSPSSSRQATVAYIPTASKRQDMTDGDDWGTGEKVFLCFSVQDTGRGLDEDERKLLFQRYSQASPKTHVQYGGSGLGLFISRGLVELQGGEIGVSSEKGTGSTFSFYVRARRSFAPKESDDPVVRNESWYASTPILTADPIRPPKPSASRTASSHDMAPPLPFSILVVEDNLVNQRVLQKQLRNLGYTVLIANHGGECIARLQESTFWAGRAADDGLELAVILMDLEMPVMDGLTCARKIRDLQKAGEVVRWRRGW